ncbi:hypothetical protein MACH05_02810 [Qipengyuania nanhaisediminis]
MIRTFGEGEDAVTLWIEKAGTGRFFNLTVIGHPFRNPYGARVSIGFLPGETISRGYVSVLSSTGRPALSLFGVSAISFEKERETAAIGQSSAESVDLTASDHAMAAPEVIRQRHDAIEAIEFSGALVQKVSLATGGMAAVFARLDDCSEALPWRRANIASGTGDEARAAATNGEREWARQIQMNYPAYLLSERAQGTVGVQVQVNPQGRASFCEILEFTGAPGLNDAACLAMLRHARFHPALDRDGNTVWGSYRTRVTYRIN